MNYEEKKQILRKKREDLMREYRRLFYKTMELAVEMGEMPENSLTPNQMFDWINFVNNSEQNEKFTRLVGALQYVESPTNQDVVSNLIENIEINNSKNRTK